MLNNRMNRTGGKKIGECILPNIFMVCLLYIIEAIGTTVRFILSKPFC